MSEGRRDVLIVEDDEDIRMDLAELLREEGYEVSSAANGGEALDILHKRPAPSVIVLDLMMPVMDGWSFREAQLRDVALASIPVLVLTATSDGARQALKLGANGFLAKPFRFDALMRELERVDADVASARPEFSLD